MSKGYLAMASFSLIVAIITVLGLSYIFISKPDYLRADRDGVAYFTPDVVHPETGEPVSLGELIRHYKGE